MFLRKVTWQDKWWKSNWSTVLRCKCSSRGKQKKQLNHRLALKIFFNTQRPQRPNCLKSWQRETTTNYIISSAIEQWRHILTFAMISFAIFSFDLLCQGRLVLRKSPTVCLGEFSSNRRNYRWKSCEIRIGVESKFRIKLSYESTQRFKTEYKRVERKRRSKAWIQREKFQLQHLIGQFALNWRKAIELLHLKWLQ